MKKFIKKSKKPLNDSGEHLHLNLPEFKTESLDAPRLTMDQYLEFVEFCLKDISRAERTKKSDMDKCIIVPFQLKENVD